MYLILFVFQLEKRMMKCLLSGKEGINESAFGSDILNLTTYRIEGGFNLE